MTAKALEPSQVIRLPMTALKEVFDENPDILVRVIQIIMIRLQRVIFTALRNYLGLYSELIQIKPHKDRKLPPQQQQQQQQSQKSDPKGSPTHHKPRPAFEHYVHTLSVEPIDLVRPDMLNDLSEVIISLINSKNQKQSCFNCVLLYFRFPFRGTIDDFQL